MKLCHNYISTIAKIYLQRYSRSFVAMIQSMLKCIREYTSVEFGCFTISNYRDNVHKGNVPPHNR